MKKLLTFAMGLALVLLAVEARAGWVTCEPHDSETATTIYGPGEAICYVWLDSESYADPAPKDFGMCDNVDVVYDNDGAGEAMCLEVCVSNTVATCAQVTVDTLSGADGDASYEGAPGTLLKPCLDGTPTTPERPKARFNCH